MKRILVVLLAIGMVWSAVPASSSFASESLAEQSPAQRPLAQETAEYPPGLSAEGVTDPLALADAHRSALSNASHTISATATFRRPNGSVLGQSTTTMRVAPGASSYYTVASQTRRNATRTLGVETTETAVWANETSAVLARQTGDGDPTYRRYSREEAPSEPTTQWELLYNAFASTNTTVVERFERDGTALFRVVSTGRDPASAYPQEAGYGFVAVVDSRGVVHTFQQTYRTTFEERPAVVSRTLHVTQVGNTTVERPDWYGNAVNESTVIG